MKHDSMKKSGNEIIRYNTVVLGRLAQLLVEEFQRRDGTSQKEELKLLGINETHYQKMIKGTMEEIPVDYLVRLCKKAKLCAGEFMPFELFHFGNEQITEEEADEIRKRITLPKRRCPEMNKVNLDTFFSEKE